MNTRLEYMYRDGHNYKEFNEVVLAGEITLDALKPHLYEGAYFMPSEVGLDDLQEFPYRDCDHIWHEIISVEPTEQLPTVETSAVDLLARFCAAGEVEWQTETVAQRMLDLAS